MGNFVKVYSRHIDDRYQSRQCYINSLKAMLFIFPTDRYVLGCLHFKLSKPFKKSGIKLEESPILHAWNRLNFGTHFEYVDFTPLDSRCMYQYEIITELSASELDRIYFEKYGVSIYEARYKNMEIYPITLKDFS